MNNRTSSLTLLQCVAAGLEELRHEVAFVGGITTCLYMDDPAAPDPPATDDVDCVIELSSLSAHQRLEERLRTIGFQNIAFSEVGKPTDPICRWLFQGIKVDVMPIDEKILGFSNIWYPEAYAHRVPITLPGGLEISIFPVMYFLATKLEAFKARGKEDWLQSRDLEDIVAVGDGCTTFATALMKSEGALRRYLAHELGVLVRSRQLLEMISGHLPRQQNEARAQRLWKIILAFVKS